METKTITIDEKGLRLDVFLSKKLDFSRSKIQKLISKSVNTTFKSFFMGFLSAAIIQSSSGTTAIAISLLSSKYIKPKDCLGIIIGANLGTCITTFIFAINTNNISLYIIFISFIIYLILSKYRKYIILTIYIGIMLLGLDILNYGFNLLINNNEYPLDLVYNPKAGYPYLQDKNQLFT